MAATTAEIQALLDPTGTGRVLNVIRGLKTSDALYDIYNVQGVTAPYAGKNRWCLTTVAGDAAAQTAEIVAVMAA